MQCSDLNHPYECRYRRRTVQRELADVDLCDGKLRELGLRYQHEKKDQRDNRENQHEDADEKSFVSSRAVDRVMVRRPLVWVKFSGSNNFVGLLRWSADVSPHDVQDGGTDERVLDGAGKQERRRVLHQSAKNVRASTLENVVRPFQATRDSRVSFLERRNDHFASSMSYTERALNEQTNIPSKQVGTLTKPMRDLKCAIFRVVERQNLVLRLLNQHAEPHRQIGSDHLRK